MDYKELIFNTDAQLKTEKKFWEEKLNGVEKKCTLRYDKTDNKVVPGYWDFNCTGDVYIKLFEGLCNSSEWHLYILLLAAMKIAVNKYNQDPDITIRIHVLDQVPGDGIEPILFVRTAVDPGQSLKQLLISIQEHVIEVNKHPDFLSFYLKDSKDPKYAQVSGISVLLTDLSFNEISVAEGIDLCLFGRRDEKSVKFGVWYNAGLYNTETIQGFCGVFLQALKCFTTNLDKSVHDLELLTERERWQLLHEFNAATLNYDRDKTVLDLFEAQVSRTPDGCAVCYREAAISYEQLNARAGSLSVELVRRGIGRNSVVGILLDPSVDLLVAILGIMKAGGAYVAIDTSYPAARKKYIISDSHVDVLVSDSSLIGANLDILQDISLDNLLDISALPLSAGEVVEGQQRQALQSSDLAYILYTSGSTGHPKGVMVDHRSLLNYLSWAQSEYMREGDCAMGLFTSASFDLTVTSIFLPLISGNRLYVYDQSADGLTVERVVSEGHVKVLKLTPSHLKVLCESGADLGGIKRIIVGGEELSGLLAQQVYEKSGYKTEIYNEYGPTEATVGCTYYRYVGTAGCVSGGQVLIGKPAANNELLILDSYGRLVPAGVAGELYIGGEQLLRGYVNSIKGTYDKLLPHPFKAGQYVYRTGDLGRWLPDGNIAFMGRIDEQVKLRGYRIELGEIVHQLLGHEDISGVHVGIKDRQGDPYLVAYYTGSKDIGREVLRSYLQERLPEYMIPWWFIRLDQIPLTSNGKVDRKQLPDPEPRESILYVAPSDEVEQKLVQVWSEVLGLPQEQISTDANFFELGGDSIKSIQLASRIHKLGYSVSVQDIFNNASIKRLSGVLQPLVAGIVQKVVEGAVLLSPVQEWFLSKRLTSAHHYNQAVMLKFAQGLSREDVISLFSRLQIHHDALRMRYHFDGSVVRQVNAGLSHPLDVTEWDLRVLTNAESLLQDYCNLLQSGISLEQGPLMKLGLFQMNEGSLLLIVIHHLVIDGVSWRILLEDLDTLYLSYKVKETPHLPSKTHSYQWWTQHLFQYKQSRSYKNACAYWSAFTGSGAGRLQRDYPQGSNTSASCETMSIIFSEKETAQLLRGVHHIYRTQLQDLLLSALAQSFYRLYGYNRLQIDLEGHGREEVIKGADISRTIGWFTSIYPMVLPCLEDAEQCIREVKESLRQVPNKGFDYLLYKYSSEYIIPLSAKSAQLSFNYLGQFDTDISGRSYELSNYATGQQHGPDNERDYDWDVLGIIAAGQLRISISYSRLQYQEHRISEFLSVYRSSLMELLSHCLLQDGRGARLTPSDLSYRGLSIVELDELQGRCRVRDIYPLSPMQEGMLFHTLLSPSLGQYFEQLSYGLSGTLDVSMVKWSLDYLMTRYDILRTQFVRGSHARNLQVVLEERSSEFTYKDIREEVALSERTVVVEGYKLADRRRGFDMESDVLMRVMLLHTGESDYEFIWSFHHILMDGWCLSILVKEFNYIYSCKQADKAVMLPTAPAYVEYIKWLNQRDEEPSRAYWKEYLSGYSTQSALPKQAGLIEEVEVRAACEHYLRLSAEETMGLQRLANLHGVTLNTLMQVLWGILLSRYTGQEDVLFGAVVSGRPAEIAGVSSMVGLFINTVPVRIQIAKQEKLGSLLKSVQAASVASLPHHYSSLAEVQGLSELGRGLLDHILVFENYPITKDVMDNEAENKWKVTHYNIYEQSNYPLTVTIIPGVEIVFKFQYDEHIYEPWLIEQCSRHLYNTITGVLNKDMVFVEDIDLLLGEEMETLLYRFNETAQEYAVGKTVLDLFEAQVSRTPDGCAVCYREAAISYDQLNARAEVLSAELVGRGIGRNSVVGILLDPSVDLLVAILGIMKAGGAYVAIDTSYPAARKKYIISDSHVEVLVSDPTLIGANLDVLQDISLDNLIDISALPLSVGEAVAGQRLQRSDLAYILYTSGSTGHPKGVMVDHRSLLNYLSWAQSEYMREGDCAMGLFTSASFDLTVTSIFLPLISGNRLYVYDQSADGLTVERVVSEGHVKVLKLTPSHLNVLCESGADLGGIKRIIVGGEELSGLLAQQVYEKSGNKTEIYNEYGPTEATVGCTYYRYVGTAGCVSGGQVLIGKPAANNELLILDSYGRLVPAGVAGELYIGGEQLLRGYVNSIKGTYEKLLPHPFKAGQYVYRTGDLGRWLADGNIAFMGRIDEQVKLRGYRIELGEIVHQLCGYEGISGAHVGIKDRQGDPYLVAYYTGSADIGREVLRSYLQERLPEYMIPWWFIRLDQIPLTSNGKVDRKQLPDPELGDGTLYVAPSGEVEQKLVQVWSEVLGLPQEQISTDANFFELGGNSLRIMSLTSRIRKAFDMNIAVADVFRLSNVQEIASFIRGKDEGLQEETALLNDAKKSRSDRLQAMKHLKKA
jgi:amino acid adenylation domain-containing protein/non-ribosomal peptide synthase protein (TIGR01720 family)